MSAKVSPGMVATIEARAMPWERAMALSSELWRYLVFAVLLYVSSLGSQQVAQSIASTTHSCIRCLRAYDCASHAYAHV